MIDSKAYYSGKEIKEAILQSAKDREIGVRYGTGGFAKRPSMLQFHGDVVEYANEGATSFHISEERWHDVMGLQPGLTKRQLDEKRSGWDLVFDIDHKHWGLAKYIAYFIIEALKFYGVKSVSAKFSGGKGFHIAVPYEAMPKELHGKDINTLYPEVPRIVAEYIKQFITPYLVEKIPEIEQKYGAVEMDITVGKEHHEVKKLSTTTMKLQTRGGVIVDAKTNKVISHESLEKKKKIIENLAKAIDPNKATELDGVLISCRHLFRAPYSLHEKSGNVSIPVDIDKILEFEKEMASVDKVKFDVPFLEREGVEKNEASALLIQALDWNAKHNKKEEEEESSGRKFEGPKVALKEEYFPPCIKEILSGKLKDGRKRSVFILINFLHNVGWSWEEIKKLLDEWNKKMEEPLRENYVLEQYNWRKRQKSNILPPNCAKDGYYKDLQICSADGLCSKIKNPVNYALLKAKISSKVKKPVKRKKVKKRVKK